MAWHGDERIPEMTDYAHYLVSKGLSGEHLRRVLRDGNWLACRPVLTNDQVDAIYDSALQPTNEDQQ